MNNQTTDQVTVKKSDNEDLKSKSIRLLHFLQEFVLLRTKIIRDVDTYKRDGLVIWFKDMPQTTGCVSPVWSEMPEGQEDLWLEVKKQNLPSLPKLPEELELWADIEKLYKSGGEEPKPNATAYLQIENANKDQEIENEENHPEFELHNIEDHPEITEKWDKYLEKWRVWSEDHARKSKVQNLYGELFRAYQTQKRLGEAYEFVIGLGLLTWKIPNSQTFHRHLLTAQAELKFDAESRTPSISICCPPPPEGAMLRIEEDVDEQIKPEAKRYQIIEEQIKDIGNAIWDHNLITPTFRGWVGSLHSESVYSDSLTPPDKITNKPILHFAPAIILRRRNVKGIVAMYRKIIDQLKNSGSIPIGLSRLVEYLDDDVKGEDKEHFAEMPDSPYEPKEIYFPLPSNYEQRNIVELLGRRKGILVQGPPGTGKSQTIANLICHLLANGQRVLITSETARALKVLKNKIPKEIKPLCVSLLGADTASFSELENSVNGISQRYSDWDEGKQQNKIKRLENKLDSLRREQADSARKLRELRESETFKITLGDRTYSGTAAKIATQISKDRSKYEWLIIDSQAPEEAPISDTEAIELIKLLRIFDSERLSELKLLTVVVENIPTPEDLGSYIEAEKNTEKLAKNFERLREDPLYEPVLNFEEERRQNLQRLLNTFIIDREKLLIRPEQWLKKALNEILSEREGKWVVLLKQTREGLENLKDSPSKVDNLTLELPEDIKPQQILYDAKKVKLYLTEGGRWSFLGIKMGPIRGREYLKSEVRVNGEPADTPDNLSLLSYAIETTQRLAKISHLWDDYIDLPPSYSLEAQVAELREHLEALELAFGLLKKTRELKRILEESEPRIPTLNWMENRPNDFQRVIEAVYSTVAVEQARMSTNKACDDLLSLLPLHNAHPVNRKLYEALEERNLKKWSKAYEELNKLQEDKENFLRCKELLGRLVHSVPHLPKEITESKENNIWDERLSHFERAWQWAKAEQWLIQREDPGFYEKIRNQVDQIDDSIAKVLSDLAVAKAWYCCFQADRFNTKVGQNLMAWREAVKHIGKGTGKKAVRYREQARKHMAECINAIPAWIMPRYRLSEVLDPQPEMFDVVIVDESSQTGIDGLFLYYLGKKIIIVGDDQQISPMGVGVPDDAVSALQKRFLEGIPIQIGLDVNGSIYSNALIRFRGKIVLREHFRCMPEIIQFSNNLCYAPNGTPLIPLRQYPPNRFEPVITRFVKKGYQEGKASTARNRPEAEAIVAQIKSCVKDSRYDKKTFGVISLLGGTQARLIQQLLTEEIGPEEMEKRDLVCGDAYAFQGDERDVMFLSMVSAPNAKIGVLSGESAKQRFNVASSRAKDQLWLFHSVKTEDLSPYCLRKKLLEYCLNPQPADLESSELQFDSDFEKKVYKHIKGRGYHVRTQVSVGDRLAQEYRIDLVVEGMRGRIAVECDGDFWHGPDRYEYDMARQRQLERAGWIFFRVLESEFNRNPETALEPLWETLHNNCIEPGGIDSSITTPPAPEELEYIIPPFDIPEEEEGETGISEPKEIPDLIDDRLKPSLSDQTQKDKKKTEYVPSEKADMDENIDYVNTIFADEWYDLSHWAKVNDHFQGWERSLLFSIGKRLARKITVTEKQARQAVRLHKASIELGYSYQPPKENQKIFDFEK